MTPPDVVQPKRRWSLFPKPLANEIERIVKPVYHQHGFTEHRILTGWAEVVGRDLAAGSVPKKLTFPKGKRENGVLHVTVSSGARALELQHMQPVILERIATYFGYRAIEKIVFLQDSSLHTAARPRKKPQMTQSPDAALTALVTPCDDAPLRAALLSLGAAIRITKQG
jgi:hypothetical protein